jgi:hypothetical protein
MDGWMEKKNKSESNEAEPLSKKRGLDKTWHACQC